MWGSLKTLNEMRGYAGPFFKRFLGQSNEQTHTQCILYIKQN